MALRSGAQARLPETKVQDDDNPSAARNRLIGDYGLIGDARRRSPSCTPPPVPRGPDEHEATTTIRSGLDAGRQKPARRPAARWPNSRSKGPETHHSTCPTGDPY
jgi:hypothetical protein